MRVVARGTGLRAGVLIGNHLREFVRLCGLAAVALYAQLARIRPGRFQAGGIIGVLRQRAVTRFAGDRGMPAAPAGFGNVRVTDFAPLAAGIHERPRRVVGNRRCPEMAEFPESFGDKERAEGHEKEHAQPEEECHPDKVFSILQELPHSEPLSRVTGRR
jgi:hypothetical protein